ncbi:MAG: 3-deoxy-manno-octulosonate cytidylyltransferase [Burkholderiaceae bacterium]
MSADFWVCIPARRASTRLPNKPLADIAGWPMVLWAAAAGLQSGAGRVIVATDDAEIFDCVMQAAEQIAAGRPGLPPTPSAHTPPRPAHQSSPKPHFSSAAQAPRLEAALTRADHPTGTDRLAEVAQRYAADPQQIIVNLQGDEPLMPPNLLARVAHRLAQDARASVATAACPIIEAHEVFSPHVVKVVCSAAGHALYFSRAPIPFWRDAWGALSGPPDETGLPAHGPHLRHLGLYAYRAGPLQEYSRWPESPLEPIEKLEQLRWLYQGHTITVEWLAEPPPAGVDTPEDLASLRQLLSLRTSAGL